MINFNDMLKTLKKLNIFIWSPGEKGRVLVHRTTRQSYERQFAYN